MTMKQTGPAISKFYGYGWDSLGRGIWVHAGGYHTLMAIDPNRHFFAVLMVQYGGKFPSPEGDGLINGFVEAAAAAVAAR
jgi:CubicO group peptidase (beta-lactamase class C family)